MFVCPNCQSENRETAKFCRRCGRAREDSAERPGDGATDTAATKDATKASPAKADAATEDPANADSKAAKGNTGQAQESRDSKGAPKQKEPSQPEVTQPEMTQLMTAGSSQCPSCWSAVRASDRFCCWCGQEQPARLLPYFKVCLECSTHLPEKANFCFSCGTDVSHQSRRKVTVPYELFQEEDSELFPRFEV